MYVEAKKKLSACEREIRNIDTYVISDRRRIESEVKKFYGYKSLKKQIQNLEYLLN